MKMLISYTVMLIGFKLYSITMRMLLEMAKRYRILRKEDGLYYPQVKAWGFWRCFKRLVQMDLYCVISYETREGAAGYLQNLFDELKPNVKYPVIAFPWSPKQ